MSLKRKIIAIDSGASNTKGTSDVGDILYSTKYSPRHTDAGYLGENTFNVTIDGKSMTIGNNATRVDKTEGKDSDIHIWSALTAIALLRGDAEEILLGYGESFNKYGQDEHKQKIINRLNGEHTVEVENTKGKKEVHKFNIILTHILPEGTGHILQNLRANMGLKYAFDWGGSTINFLEILNGRPTENSLSFPFGMHNIVAQAKLAIAKANLGTFTETQIKEWIEKGCANRDIQREIDYVIEEQLYKIDSELSGLNINLHDFLEVDFTGGTCQLFQSQIKAHWSCARILPECIMNNVKGFYEYMRLKYGNQAI